ncbi:hypothetical protein DPMN_125962 [Dreissena polymorpha]|uniref:Uncharacterized protein n=1 Tax=Dreissena polymorpha TaxID=45954 RepID=A0A9D4JXP2_DREPO|nr:hypothetical protein DPMN_125962 [Dreissena polymorpha]
MAAKFCCCSWCLVMLLMMITAKCCCSWCLVMNLADDDIHAIAAVGAWWWC